MHNNHIYTKIQKFKHGDNEALNEIIIQMMPLLKKSAHKTHFMEYEDALQEYSISLIESIQKIQIYDNDGQCLTYIKTCIKNKFCALYKKHCTSIYDEISLESTDSIESPTNSFNDIDFWSDINHLIEQLPTNSKKEIAKLSLIEGKSDLEIATQLNLSRQYVNRIKREIYHTFSENY